ncbi:hypothetical protein QTP86_029857, partial [Hemibagrus guttatus]
MHVFGLGEETGVPGGNPPRVRADQGVENVDVSRVMFTVCGTVGTRAALFQERVSIINS